MRQWTIDAFASEPFRGNPACVVEPFDTWPDVGWMQRLAAENNQAETAYLLETADPSRFGLRWFTPTVEVPLCGHGTLASAHALFTEMAVADDRLIFDSQSGPLTVTRADAGYEMDFPADLPTRVEIPDGLADALGAEPVEAWTTSYLVAVLADEAAVRGLNADVAALRSICSAATQGRGNVAVTARADLGRTYDIVSRFFAPGSGISEDPATGSLHCGLAALWVPKLQRETLICHQAFPGRGADMTCALKGDRVLIQGQAVTVIESRLRL